MKGLGTVLRASKYSINGASDDFPPLSQGYNKASKCGVCVELVFKPTPFKLEGNPFRAWLVPLEIPLPPRCVPSSFRL